MIIWLSTVVPQTRSSLCDLPVRGREGGLTYAEAKHGIDGTGWGKECGIAAESMGIAFVEFSVRRCRAKRSKMERLIARRGDMAWPKRKSRTPCSRRRYNIAATETRLLLARRMLHSPILSMSVHGAAFA